MVTWPHLYETLLSAVGTLAVEAVGAGVPAAAPADVSTVGPPPALPAPPAPLSLEALVPAPPPPPPSTSPLALVSSPAGAGFTSAGGSAMGCPARMRLATLYPNVNRRRRTCSHSQPMGSFDNGKQRGMTQLRRITNNYFTGGSACRCSQYKNSKSVPQKYKNTHTWTQMQTH